MSSSLLGKDFYGRFGEDNKLIHGEKVMPFVTEMVTEIDTLDDFKYLEYQVEDEKDYGDRI